MDGSVSAVAVAVAAGVAVASTAGRGVGVAEGLTVDVAVAGAGSVAVGVGVASATSGVTAASAVTATAAVAVAVTAASIVAPGVAVAGPGSHRRWPTYSHCFAFTASGLAAHNSATDKSCARATEFQVSPRLTLYHSPPCGTGIFVASACGVPGLVGTHSFSPMSTQSYRRIAWGFVSLRVVTDTPTRREMIDHESPVLTV